MSSPLFLFLATVAMLVGGLDCLTHFWKGIIQGLSKQSLVPIGPVVSEMQIFKMSSPFFIFSNSGHVGWRSGPPDTILEADRPWTIPPKFGLKWPSGFRGEDGLVIVDGRTTDAVMTKAHLILWVRWAKRQGGGGRYHIISYPR